MKALVIAPQPFFSPRGTPFSVYYRTLMMAREGVEIDFLTYGQGQDVDLPHVRFYRIPAFRALGPVPIGPSVLKLFLDVFIFLFMIRLLATRRYDFVHAHEEAVFFALFLKPLFRFKLVYDMHSSLSQQMTNFQFTQSKLIIGIFALMEDLSLKHADAVITICPDLFAYVNTRIDCPDKHFLIENSLFEPVRVMGNRSAKGDGTPGVAAADIAADIKKNDQRLIVYAGTLEPYQGIDILIRAMAKLCRRKTDVHCLVVGGNRLQVTAFEKMAAEHEITPYVTFTGQVEQSQARAAAACADVLVSPRSSGTNTPLKIYEQLASGIPLVATRIHSHTQVLDERVAFLAEPDGDAFAAALQAVFGDSAAARKKALFARRLYDQKYAPKIYANKIAKLLEWLR